MAIQINDEAGIFSPGDVTTLNATAGRWPFEVRVITSTSSASKAAFEARVSAAVTGPDVVAIGIDPTHRFVIVHFGTETGIAPSQWASITSAGNADFKSAMWAQGLTKIADRATNAKQAALSVQAPSSGGHVATIVGLSLAAVVLAALAIVLWRNKKRASEHARRMAELDAEIAEQRSRNIKESAWHEKFQATVPSAAPPPPRTSHAAAAPAASVRAPAPAPQAPAHDAAEASRAALMATHARLVARMEARMDEARRIPRSAAVATSSPVHVHHHHHDHPGQVLIGAALSTPYSPPPAPPPSSAASSSNSGGSSSSWGSSSSSSYDSGGSSSSWGSSSSSYDSGGSSSGGGFDSGGGSSSW